MEGKRDMITQQEARSIMGGGFIGRQEYQPLYDAMRNPIPFDDPEIQYTKEQLTQYKESHLLVLVQPLSIRELRDHFGVDPDKKEPCFYNQDWYLSEEFIDFTENAQWCLLRKEVFENSRSILPNVLNETINFPTAQQCIFTFFAYYFATGKKLWEYDFVWCRDLDHNGDRIYVGKYTDIDGVNKSGFSIHRHLALRPCYGAIDIL